MGKAREQSNIDKKALKNYLMTSKHKMGELSVQLGYSPSYLSDVLREGTRKQITVPAYKYLCSILGVPEDKFYFKEESKKADDTPKQVVASGMTPEQFNALLQAISGLTDTLDKALNAIANAQQSNSIISGKIYGEVVAVADALGVHSNPTPGNGSAAKPANVQAKYSPHFGEKKNA